MNIQFFCFTQVIRTVSVSSHWGIIASGYVDHGAYLNFTGPGLSFSHLNNKSQLTIGMLPSLRFKEDSGTIKNSFATPSLGLGLTYSYKAVAIQLPVYYNPKNSTTSGSWKIGIGIGLKISEIKFLKK